MSTPSELIPTLADASDNERAGLDASLTRERTWYANAPRFQTDADIKEAVERGELVLVNNTDDFLLTARFKSGAEGFSPYLTPRAKRMTEDFSHYWRVLLWQDYQIQPPVDFLAATSMVRSQVYQDKIVSGGRLASPDSTHCTGNAIDFDSSGYYRLGPNGEIWSHTHPGRRAGQLAVRAELEKRFGVMPDAPQIAGWYNPQINEAAERVAQAMHDEGLINLVKEFSGTPNATLHLAVSPDYPTELPTTFVDRLLKEPS